MTPGTECMSQGCTSDADVEFEYSIGDGLLHRAKWCEEHAAPIMSVIRTGQYSIGE